MDVVELMKKEMLRRKYSVKTIKSYVYCVKKFLLFYQREMYKINKYAALDYLNKLNEENYSGSTININLQALKFLMEEILHKKKTFYHIKYSRTPMKLPEVLIKGEIISLINAIKNKKHRLMIKLMYSAGLRVNELIQLRVRDFVFEMNYGWVRNGKGGKDRLFIIAKKIKKELQTFIHEEGINLDSWLFRGRNGPISPRSIQEIVRKAAKKAKIRKRVHPHTLRHSFSTHLIENGNAITSVQSLLGHCSLETTMIYLHTALPTMVNVESPLDSLELGK